MDLSKVLGDVYDTDETAASPASAPVRQAPTVPEWADDDRLDRAFASWTPGPPADAPAAEREMATGGGPARARLDEMLAATQPVTATAPAYEALAADAAAYEAAAAPVYEAPAAPAYETPVYEAPADPVYEAPAAYEPAPAYEAPAAPVYEAPPAYEAPAAVTPPPPPLPPAPPAPPAPIAFEPPPPAPAPVAVYGSTRQWVRGDDDVLAMGSGGKRRRR